GLAGPVLQREKLYHGNETIEGLRNRRQNYGIFVVALSKKLYDPTPPLKKKKAGRAMRPSQNDLDICIKKKE
ncbi:MAG TPA: hypothetical protein VF498_14575, partial [Anaerolineales bacterium]